MATDPQNRAEIRQQRAKRADGGEPLHSYDSTVYTAGNSIVMALHSYAVRTHDIDAGSEPTVEVHQDGIWVDFSGDSDGE